MSGAREFQNSPSYGPKKDSILRPDPKRDATGIFSAIENAWRYLFGRKKSSWTDADEAKDEAARRRVAEHDRRFYEGRK